MADLVLGDERVLTPREAFVLGGAILCHDLANGAAAHPGGMAQLRDSEVWRDAVASAQRRCGRPAVPDASVSPEIAREADGWALRRMHAEQAAKLPTTEWSDSRGRTTRLLADDELRDELGPLIGQLAQSHWFNIGQLRGPFEAEVAGPTWCPREWTIDPLTVACLLRLADAAHIDGAAVRRRCSTRCAAPRLRSVLLELVAAARGVSGPARTRLSGLGAPRDRFLLGVHLGPPRHGHHPLVQSAKNGPS